MRKTLGQALPNRFFGTCIFVFALVIGAQQQQVIDEKMLHPHTYPKDRAVSWSDCLKSRCLPLSFLCLQFLVMSGVHRAHSHLTFTLLNFMVGLIFLRDASLPDEHTCGLHRRLGGDSEYLYRSTSPIDVDDGHQRRSPPPWSTHLDLLSHQVDSGQT